jgi:hypothetical protein
VIRTSSSAVRASRIVLTTTSSARPPDRARMSNRSRCEVVSASSGRPLGTRAVSPGTSVRALDLRYTRCRQHQPLAARQNRPTLRRPYPGLWQFQVDDVLDLRAEAGRIVEQALELRPNGRTPTRARIGRVRYLRFQQMDHDSRDPVGEFTPMASRQLLDLGDNILPVDQVRQRDVFYRGPAPDAQCFRLLLGPSDDVCIMVVPSDMVVRCSPVSARASKWGDDSTGIWLRVVGHYFRSRGGRPILIDRVRWGNASPRQWPSPGSPTR